MSTLYRCSGDMPGAHVACDFTSDTLTGAIDHFEATSHNVDAIDIAQLADMLAKDIRDNVSAEDYASIQADIARDPMDIAFPIDTNECMIAVWEAYFGRTPDADSDYDTAVWNAVWVAAVTGPLRDNG